MMAIVGYIGGITSKLAAPLFKLYVMSFYILDLAAVSVDLALYFRNRMLDKKADRI